MRYTPPALKTVFVYLVGVEVALTLAHVLVHVLAPEVRWGPLRALFDLDAEASIPTWFSTVQLFVISGVLFVTSGHLRQRDRRERQRDRRVLSSLFVAGGFFFLFLSMDEGAAIHEKVTPVARKLDWDWLLFAGQHGGWMTLYLAVAAVLALALHRYLFVLWGRFRREMQVALRGAAVYLIGAMLFETFSYLFVLPQGRMGLHEVQVTFEEFLEMFGVTLMLYAALLMNHAASGVPPRHSDGRASAEAHPVESRPAG